MHSLKGGFIFETRNTSDEQDSKLINCLNFKKYNFNNDNKTCIDSILNSLKIHDFSSMTL